MKNIFNSPKLANPLPTHDNFETAPVNIAFVLTGGGSKGAFEAGVVEAVIPQLQQIGKISLFTGTSAGAVNAIAVGGGLNASGTDEAILRLRHTWNEVTSYGQIFSRYLRFMTDPFLPKDQRWPNLPQLPFNPMQVFQPFMPSLTAQFISATVKQVTNDWSSEIQNGAVKIAINTILEDRQNPGKFEHVVLTGRDLTPDGVGGSANLKQLGVHYIRDTANPLHQGRRAYDGAYQENGLLHPYLDDTITDYIMIILHDRRHNNLDKVGALKHAEIHEHALALVTSDSHAPARLHAIEIESLGGEIDGLSHINDSSKFNTSQEFIDLLYASGVAAGKKWLQDNLCHVGGETSSYKLYPPALKQLAEMSYV